VPSEDNEGPELGCRLPEAGKVRNPCLPKPPNVCCILILDPEDPLWELEDWLKS
jgi:hypothetical protein